MMFNGSDVIMSPSMAWAVFTATFNAQQRRTFGSKPWRLVSAVALDRSTSGAVLGCLGI